MILALDPGETTGYVIFEKQDSKWKLLHFGQISVEETPKFYETWIKAYNFDIVIIEDYRIRPDTAMAHVGQELITPKLIGVLEYISKKHNQKYILQPAGTGRQFFNNKKKLEKYNLWLKAMKHSRSALFHALYYIKFVLKEKIDIYEEKEA